MPAKSASAPKPVAAQPDQPKRRAATKPATSPTAKPARKPAARSKPTSGATLLGEEALHQMIRDRAYFLWQAAGGQHGNDQEYWYVAEREIRSTQAR